jgi:hypothetical protein
MLDWAPEDRSEDGSEDRLEQLARAIDQADFDSAARSARLLKADIPALAEHELLFVKAQLERYQEQARKLRETYGGELKSVVRGRQSINAYRDGVAQP